MKCVSVAGSESNPELQDRSAPQPKPGNGELLIRVRAAGVMPSELHWYPTWHSKTGTERMNAVPSHEFSGVVTDAGQDVGNLEIGREVFGMNDWYTDGALADFCTAPFFAVAEKPPRLSYQEAASAPIGALTAWQALFHHAKLQKGETVLVHAGAGGVGLFAVQLAKLHGATVIATALRNNLDFVRSLGADDVIDYRTTRFEDRVKSADVVLDTVGGETLERSWNILSPAGRLVTVVSSAANTNDDRVKRAFFIVEPNQKQLCRIADLLAGGSLKAVVDTVVPLSKASDAYFNRIERQGRGKVVVDLHR